MNPHAGTQARHAQAALIVQTLRTAGFRVELTTDPEALADTALTLNKEGALRTVLAIGGDGTAAVVRKAVPLDVPLVVVPMGTENLLGRYLRQSTAPDAIRDVVENGLVVDLDLCRANGQYFLSMMSAGFDAAVVRSLHENRRGNIRHLDYLGPVLQTARRYRFPTIRVCWDSASIEPTECRWLFAFNLPLYALDLPIAPAANGSDGLLDVCAWEQGSIWSVARYLWHVFRRTHLLLPDVRQYRVHRFRVESTDGSQVSYQLDGDFAGVLPLEVEVLPGNLRLLVSTLTAARLGFDPSHLPGK
jgi:diacylglycerol kinase family enzyme